jgi:hypothetical protein
VIVAAEDMPRKPEQRSRRMANTVKTKAERLFAESETKAKEALNERDKARQKSAAHNAKLRELRYAKMAAEKAAASEEAGKKSAPKRKPAAAKPEGDALAASPSR